MNTPLVEFVGAGPGAEDLITVRGLRALEQADLVVYAGSLVNPAHLKACKANCTCLDSASMNLGEQIEAMSDAALAGKRVVRLHTGDPCLYGAIREQMDALDRMGIAYDVCPGVSSFCGAAAALNLEYTLPEVSQSVIITRMEGRTKVPEKESIRSFAAHQATMVLFLSTGLLEELSGELIVGGYKEDTPAAIVYKASWPEEAVYRCTVGTLAATTREKGVARTALIVVGRVLDTGKDSGYERSRLYAPEFDTMFRNGSGKEGK